MNHRYELNRDLREFDMRRRKDEEQATVMFTWSPRPELSASVYQNGKGITRYTITGWWAVLGWYYLVRFATIRSWLRFQRRPRVHREG